MSGRSCLKEQLSPKLQVYLRIAAYAAVCKEKSTERRNDFMSEVQAAPNPLRNHHGKGNLLYRGNI